MYWYLLQAEAPPPLFVTASHQTWLDTQSMSKGRFILETGMLGSCRGSNPAGLCWSSAHSVQCEPDELCWRWTQTWAQARMPDNSLNWTNKSCNTMFVKDIITNPMVAQQKPGAFRPRILPLKSRWLWASTVADSILVAACCLYSV